MLTLVFRTGICGDNFSYVRGDEVDWLDERDAARLIRAGIAAPKDAAEKAKYQAALQELEAAEAKPTAKPKPKPAPQPAVPLVPAPVPQDEEPAPSLHSDQPVDALDLDEDTLAALKKAGLGTVGQVAAHEDLTKLHGVGPATAKKINQALAAIA